MSEINIPPREAEALKAVDLSLLRASINQCLQDERADTLRPLRLEDCGLYVANKLHEFRRCLDEYRVAKAASKRASTAERARRAGDGLTHAVEQMLGRLRIEEEESEFFRIFDHIYVPHEFDENISISVGFMWRPSLGDEWRRGSVTFSHRVSLRPDYAQAGAKRKKTAAQKRIDRQEELFQTWDYLKMLCLTSVREFFRAGGNGADVPEAFQIRVDPLTGSLNNFSADFWGRREGVTLGKPGGLLPGRVESKA